MSLSVIVPQFIATPSYSDTRAELLSSSVAESTHDTYAAGTTYASDDYVKYVTTVGTDQGIYKIYKSLQDANTGNTPDLSPLWWSDQGASDRWKMFDFLNLTTTSDSSNNINVKIHCRKISSIAFLTVQASSITIDIYDGSTLGSMTFLKTVTINLSQEINNWFDYFFSDFDYVRDVSTPVDLLLYQNVILDITFSKISGSDCYCGQCLPGRSYDLGTLQYGISTGIKDYSKKDTDSVFGYTYLNQGNYKKTMDCNLLIENTDLTTTNSILTQLRSIPTVWNANQPGVVYDNLLVYGFYSDFRIIMPYPNYSQCSLTIEGLI